MTLLVFQVVLHCLISTVSLLGFCVVLYSLILGGGLNCWLDPVLDRPSLKPTSLSKSALHVHSSFSTYGVRDIWRHPTDRERSFFFNLHHTFSRIDYFF